MTLRQRYYISKIGILEAIERFSKRVIKHCEEYQLVQDETKPTSVDLGDGPKPLSKKMSHSDQMNEWR